MFNVLYIDFVWVSSDFKACFKPQRFLDAFSIFFVAVAVVAKIETHEKVEHKTINLLQSIPEIFPPEMDSDCISVYLSS